MLDVEDLDATVAAKPLLVSEFESAIAHAIQAAYKQHPGDDSAHRFLQRVLYLPHQQAQLILVRRFASLQ